MALSNSKRWIYGGLGALAPIFVAGMNIDASGVQNLLAADSNTIVGFCIRTVFLLGVGGFVSYLHDKNSDPWAAVVIGIGAPALIAGFLANAGQHKNFSSAETKPTVTIGEITGFVSSALASERLSAASSSTAPQIFPMCMPRGSAYARFLSGVYGDFKQPKDLWWVTSNPIDRQTAVVAYQRYLQRYRAFSVSNNITPRIFSVRDRFIVAIAANLTPQQATQLVPRAPILTGVTFEPAPMNQLLLKLQISADALKTCPFQEDHM